MAQDLTRSAARSLTQRELCDFLTGRLMVFLFCVGQETIARETLTDWQWMITVVPFDLFYNMTLQSSNEHLAELHRSNQMEDLFTCTSPHLR